MLRRRILHLRVTRPESILVSIPSAKALPASSSMRLNDRSRLVMRRLSPKASAITRHPSGPKSFFASLRFSRWMCLLATISAMRCATFSPSMLSSRLSVSMWVRFSIESENTAPARGPIPQWLVSNCRKTGRTSTAEASCSVEMSSNSVWLIASRMREVLLWMAVVMCASSCWSQWLFEMLRLTIDLFATSASPRCLPASVASPPSNVVRPSRFCERSSSVNVLLTLSATASSCMTVGPKKFALAVSAVRD
mmetsp:Transcript_2003/g.4079  ORF Transcript_2003/g.4079 Transcript_2003/m.4079 type:complete len:251 (+) Transcript_2003:1192-1944(+)